MDERFYETAVFMQENPAIGKEYILANPKYTQSDLKLLEGIDFKTLKTTRAIFSGGRYLFYEPMKNGEGESIGAFIFSLSPKQISTYTHSDEEDISFLIHLSRNELYDVMVKKSLDNAQFQSVYDKELLYLKDTVPPEDRELYLQEARERLNTYSKEELIGIMLDYKVTKEITRGDTMKVLLLEDEYMLRVSITEFLEELGFEVFGFSNGERAFDAIYETHFDHLSSRCECSGDERI
jgi:hypothetical protein